MMNRPKVTLRAQWLGKLLRELREENAMTLKEPADHIRRSAATLSRYESGTLPVPRDEVELLMNLYGVEGQSQRTLMLRLADEIVRTGWWDRYHKDVYHSTFDWVWLESQAERLRIFESTVIPGILQTQQYAEQLIRIDDPDATAQQIERWVNIRMTRQQLLTQEQPPKLELLLDEATLRRAVGGTDVMRGQLQRLLTEAEKSNMDIRVLPFSIGEYPGPKSSFMLVKMPDPFPEIVSIASAAGNVFLEAEDVTEFNTVYARLQDMCLDAKDSAAFLAAIEKDLP